MARIVLELDQNQIKSVKLEGVYHLPPTFWERVELLTDRALVAARATDLNKPEPTVEKDVRKPVK